MGDHPAHRKSLGPAHRKSLGSRKIALPLFIIPIETWPGHSMKYHCVCAFSQLDLPGLLYQIIEVRVDTVVGLIY